MYNELQENGIAASTNNIISISKKVIFYEGVPRSPVHLRKVEVGMAKVIIIIGVAEHLWSESSGGLLNQARDNKFDESSWAAVVQTDSNTIVTSITLHMVWESNN